MLLVIRRFVAKDAYMAPFDSIVLSSKLPMLLTLIAYKTLNLFYVCPFIFSVELLLVFLLLPFLLIIAKRIKEKKKTLKVVTS